ncbi:hypothetical protein H4S06_005312, partial [Coemansia sp. BCRC 34490]
MTVPTALGRTRSADSKLYYQQIAQLQLRLQQNQQHQQQQQQQIAHLSLPRTSTAPAESAADICAHGLVREALELDKLYDITCVIIESIWPHHSVSHRTQLCSLRCFVAETHRQSRLTLDALELCMFYLLRAKSIIQAKQRAAKQREERQEQQEQQEQVQKAAAAAVQQQNAVGMTLPLTPRSPQSSAGGAPKTGNVVAVAAGGSATSSAVMVVPGGSSTSSSSSTDRLISPTDSSPFTPVSAQQMGHGIGFVGMMDKHHLLANDMITHHGHNLNQLDSADPKAIIGSKQYQQRAIAGSTGTLPLSYRSFVAAAANKQPQMQTQ